MSASGYDFQRRWQDLDAQNAAMNDPVAFAARRQATLNAEREFQRQMHGDFQQNAALQREIQGTYNQKAMQEQLIHGTAQDRYAQEKLIQGTQEQRAQTAKDLEQMREESATKRTSMSEEGATGRARLAQEGENWRRMWEPVHYVNVPVYDKEGNHIGNTVQAWQGGKQINQTQDNNITAKVAPSGYKDVDHFMSVYQNLPKEQRSQFLSETRQSNPDMLIAARNKMQDQLKSGAKASPAASSVPPATPSPLIESPTAEAAPSRPKPIISPYSGPSAMPDIEARYFVGETTGGDINPVTFPRRPASETPPDLSYVARTSGMSAPVPEEPWTPSFIPRSVGLINREDPARNAPRYPMPAPIMNYGSPVRRPIPEPERPLPDLAGIGPTTPMNQIPNPRYPMPDPNADYGEPIRRRIPNPETPLFNNSFSNNFYRKRLPKNLY